MADPRQRPKAPGTVAFAFGWEWGSLSPSASVADG